MRAWVVKSGRGWLPADEESAELHKKMGDGECSEMRVVRPRSSAWNRLYWGLCRVIGENQDPQRDEDSIDAELRILAGHYDVMYVKGHEVRVPKRIAFDKMTGDEWSDYWKRVEPAIAERFGSEYLAQIQMGGAA